MSILPIIIVADNSGSMAQDCKIDALNDSIRALIGLCASMSCPTVDIAVVALLPEGGPHVVVPLQRAAAAVWTKELVPTGKSALGAALTAAAGLIAGHSHPDSLLRPIIVVASDGGITDGAMWIAACERVRTSTITSGAIRVAIAIGVDADVAMLETFAGTTSDGRPLILLCGAEADIIGLNSGFPLNPSIAHPLLMPQPLLTEELA